MPEIVQHIPVLLDEVLEYLSPKSGESYLDLTAGYGGHATQVLAITQAEATLVDRDENAHHSLSELFRDNKNVRLIQKDFEQASIELADSGQTFDIILADLGISSPHIDNKQRGFSIKQDGPLDMRMDQAEEKSAETVVNTYSQEALATLLKKYGEEPKAEKIARLIVEARPIATTGQLASIVAKAWPGYSKVHPATRTFQAIRIEVNDELGQLERSLPLWVSLLSKHGRLGVITFHSLEDRVVKHFFKEHSGDRYDAKLELVTAKAIVAGSEELVHNPRARSAKLRVVKRK